MGIIYLRTNLVNGKQYVGQTNNLKERNKAFKKMSTIYGNIFLSRDREKYGLDAFNLDILEECEDEKVDELERYYIEKFNTIYPNGYNIQTGGKKGFTYKESNEAKEKKSLSHKGKIPPCVTEKPVYQYTLDGKLIAFFKNTRMAEKETNIFHANISRCCNGGFFNIKRNKWVNVKQAGGYRWSFKPL